MEEAIDLTAEQRVRLIVGGNFTPDALGPAHAAILNAVRENPREHFRAFERLFLSREPGRRTLTELFLPAFLTIISEYLPNEAKRAARFLAGRMASIARAQEAEYLESGSERDLDETRRQQRQLNARLAALRDLAGRGR